MVGVVVAEVVCDEVMLLVTVLVGEVVAEEVAEEVGDAVTLLVPVDVAVDVGVEVAVVVADVVGVVTSQFWNRPARYASVIRLSVPAVSSQLLSPPSVKYFENAQPMVGDAVPSAGPRNSWAAKLMAFAVSVQLPPPPSSTSAGNVSPSSTVSSHDTDPGTTARSVPANSAAHTATKSLMAAACASQLCVLST